MPIEQVQLGDTSATKSLNLREPHARQVEAKKTEWNETDGQTVILRAAPQPGARQAVGVKALPGTLVHRIVWRR